MAKKSPSNAVRQAVQTVVAEPVVETTGERAKKISSEVYLREYLAECENEEGTWESLCERCNFTRSSVVQCITDERSAWRRTTLERFNSLKPAQAKQVLTNTGRTDGEDYADYVASLKVPHLKGASTRNTAKAKRRSEMMTMELPGM